MLGPQNWLQARLLDERDEILDELGAQGIVVNGIAPASAEYGARPGARQEVVEALVRLERIVRVLP